LGKFRLRRHLSFVFAIKRGRLTALEQEEKVADFFFVGDYLETFAPP